MEREKFMKEAVHLAKMNVSLNGGGPFGAVVVKEGKIIAAGQNQVTASCDPTAHAEIRAIRAACEVLRHQQLDGCEIYTSCEPCPMCLGAIYWARPKAVYYACTKDQAAAIGFDDHFIYTELVLPKEERRLSMKQLIVNDSDIPFARWEASTKKLRY
ncbi:tRNA-specific adenosine deaminase [Peribacillus deserti]|uniref:tRNA-specific adenosine deaminase n=1 Tax=Peribacillus deserti TaxID=673318 RepID=A0A2N5M4T1_9BACI|nr:nucleoside deaminase [Peribacillus deserti]PLT29381.1 tRNA-specific adenosine deaminase [Peribacillus deserti]